jgi:ribosomal protein L28
MSRRCNICGRGPQKVIRRSHSKHAVLAKQYLNLQVRKVGNKKIKVCTRCLKTLTSQGKTLTQAKKK